ncbi:hypothetical protein [Streptomyces californicus]|uniref:hypothetical protein n=1 Tax=Streptomyces californicus TaxID=67351 RepID=UPI0004BF7E3E|nr:hypothetical protein [Streptomyces californicus]QRV59514.1 hypothetical protein I6J40_35290 [Streptomyces californicus]
MQKPAAVDVQGLAGDERGGWSRQKGDGGGQQAADWTRKHVDAGDNAIVTTHFQAWTDRPVDEPKYELVLVLLAM